jgi:hypothetical protein
MAERRNEPARANGATARPTSHRGLLRHPKIMMLGAVAALGITASWAARVRSQSPVSGLIVFEPQTPARATDVNANFTLLAGEINALRSQVTELTDELEELQARSTFGEEVVLPNTLIETAPAALYYAPTDGIVTTVISSSSAVDLAYFYDTALAAAGSLSLACDSNPSPCSRTAEALDGGALVAFVRQGSYFRLEATDWPVPADTNLASPFVKIMWRPIFAGRGTDNAPMLQAQGVR